MSRVCKGQVWRGWEVAQGLQEGVSEEGLGGGTAILFPGILVNESGLNWLPQIRGSRGRGHYKTENSSLFTHNSYTTH